MERLRKAGNEWVYRCAKQHGEIVSDRRGPRADELTLTPLELINRIAALVPPPRDRATAHHPCARAAAVGSSCPLATRRLAVLRSKSRYSATTPLPRPR